MSNFFSLYADYVKDYEPPFNYHAWSAVGAISALLGKKCVIPYGTFNVYPNLYIILVGQPGMKKSSAMNVAKKLVRSVPEVRAASDCGSREGLMDEMAKNKVVANGTSYWQSAIFVDEIADLLGGEHLDKSMIQFLTTIWDVSVYREATRKSGQVCIHNPYLTLLGCCPTEWMMTKLKQDIFTGGLVRRMIFVLETKLARLNSRPPIPNPLITEELIKESQRIQSLEGSFNLSKEAWERFDNFYYDLNSKLSSYPANLQIYLSSKHMLVLKVAMILSAGVDSSKIVSLPILEVALMMLQQVEDNLPELFAGVGRNELKSYSEKVLNKIKASGEAGCKKSTLLREFYTDIDEIELGRIIEVLQDTKQIHSRPSSMAQGAPAFVALEDLRPPRDVNLLRLVSQLKPCSAKTLEETVISEPVHHLDPATVQFLSLQAQWKQQTDSGLLMKGKPAQDAGE